MTIQDIEKIIKIFENGNINSMNLEIDNLKIELKKDCSNIVSKEENIIKNDLEEMFYKVKSPIVGCYHKASSQGGSPLVYEGKEVKEGDKLCIVEAMKVMNEIVSPINGTIKKVYLNEGDIVEYDSLLFLIEEENV